MAKVLGGGQFGSLSGKLGSSVFARNRGGNYVRNYVKPTDHRSASQVSTRAKFTTASTSFKALNSLQKLQWNSFANTIFLNSEGGFFRGAGIAAFISLYQSVLTYRSFVAPTIKFNGTPVVSPVYLTPTFSNTPPSHMLQPNFKSNSGNLVQLVEFQFSNFHRYDSTPFVAFDFDLTITLKNPLGVTNILSSLKDINDNYIFFNVYMSNPIITGTMFIQNKRITHIQSLRGLTSFSNVTNPTELKYEVVGALIDPNNFKYLPPVGSYVQASLDIMSSSGMRIRQYAQIVQII
jgi:hypothetical protein